MVKLPGQGDRVFSGRTRKRRERQERSASGNLPGISLNRVVFSVRVFGGGFSFRRVLH